MKGFSSRNIKYMRPFAEAYGDDQIVQQAAAQIPLGHKVRILDYVKAAVEREWYIRRNSLVTRLEYEGDEAIVINPADK